MVKIYPHSLHRTHIGDKVQIYIFIWLFVKIQILHCLLTTFHISVGLVTAVPFVWTVIIHSNPSFIVSPLSHFHFAKKKISARLADYLKYNRVFLPSKQPEKIGLRELPISAGSYNATNFFRFKVCGFMKIIRLFNPFVDFSYSLLTAHYYQRRFIQCITILFSLLLWIEFVRLNQNTTIMFASHVK